MVYWLGATSLLMDISSEMVSSVLPIFMFTALAMSPLQVGVIDGVFQGLASLTRVLAAHRADALRDNHRIAWAGYAMSAVAVGLLLLSMAGGALFAFVALMLDRLGKGIRTAPRDALIAAHAGSGRINAAFGVHRSMDAAGAFAGPLMAGAILWLWVDRYEILLAVSLAFAIASVLVFGAKVRNPVDLPDACSATGGGAPAKGLVARVAQLLRYRPYRRLLLAVGGLGIFTVSDGMLFLALQQQTQMPPRYMPLVYVASALVFLLAVMPLARAADRWGARRILVSGYLCLGLAYGCLQAWPLAEEVRVIAVALLVGLSHAATDGILAIMVVALVPRGDRTTGLALMGTVSGLAKLVSSPLLGWLWQSVSVLHAVAMFGGGLLFFIAVLMCGVPARWNRHE